MYMLFNYRKQLAVAGGFLALSAIAAAGWMRKPASTTSAMPNPPASVYTQPPGNDQNDQQYSQHVRLADYTANPCDVNGGRVGSANYPVSSPGSSYNEDGYYSSAR